MHLAEDGARDAAGGGAVAAADHGGVSLFKWHDPTSTTSLGWKDGDRMLVVPWQGSDKLTWAENSSRLRTEMSAGKPIYETYVDANGDLIRAGGPGNSGKFQNAERNLLSNHGWTYNPTARAWFPPGS